MEIDVDGAWNLATAFVKNTELKDGDGPVFIGLNILRAHLLGTQVTTAPTSYAVSKIAAAKLMENLASDSKGVEPYALHPGIVKTEMSLKSLGMAPEVFDPDWDDVNVTAHFCVWLSTKEGKVMIPTGRYL